MQDLGTLGGNNSEAEGINDYGYVVGTASLGDVSHAFIWDKNEGMKDLGILPGGAFSRAFDINSTNQVVGWCSVGNAHAFLWDEVNGMQDLGFLPNGKASLAFGINDKGQVVGRAMTATSVNGHAFLSFLWDEVNGMQDLGSLEKVWSEASDINIYGQVVGKASDLSASTAFLWDKDNGMQNIGTLGGSEAYATAINKYGQVVGYSKTSSGYRHAFVWDEVNGMQDLNDLIPSNSGWDLQQASGINDLGQIVGSGNINGELHAYLLTPTSISASVDIHPDIINRKSKGRWITCYIELLESHNVVDIDVSTVELTLDSTAAVQAEAFPTEVADYDNDGTTDLMVKFDRQAVHTLCTPDAMELTVRGVMLDGREFRGVDTVLVIDKGNEHINEVNHGSVEY